MEGIKKFLESIEWNESIQFETGFSDVEMELPNHVIDKICVFIQAITDSENQPNQYGINLTPQQ